MKVIHILPYSSLVTGRDFKVDLFADGYHVRVAQQIWKRTKKYQHECWRPERMLKETITGEKDGIVYRAFPSFRPTLGYLDKFVYKGTMATFPSVRFGLWREYSLAMLEELGRQCRSQEVIVHIYHIHSDLSYLICLQLRNVPVVGAHAGTAPYTYSPLTFIYHLPLSFVERRALRNVDKILVTSRWICNSLAGFHKDIVVATSFGIDFERLRPVEKQKARKALGLELDKKVLLHVGRFDNTKGVDTCLAAYENLKNSYDVELVLIGGLKTDPLYHSAVRAGATVREWVLQNELIPYYSAADVYLFPKFYPNRTIENLEEFMGMGTAVVESLACGTPVVGTNLKHFMGDADELSKLGIIPDNPDDVATSISRVLEHPEQYQNCREIVRKYYSWEVIAQQLVAVYDELLEEYYGTSS